ncbi:MAG: hypothetical protein AABY68_12790 [Pseudomonadota bacterium]
MNVVVQFDTNKNPIDDQLIADLQEAANKLLMASDADFQRLKMESWYTRVIGRLTFTDKKGQQIASQINSLMQAQICVIKILAGFSGRISQAFDLLKMHASHIERLANGSVALANLSLEVQGRVQKLEERDLGVSRASDFRELPDSGKVVLLAVLDALAERFGDEISEEQRRYLNWVHRNCGDEVRQVYSNDPVAAYENVDDVQQQKLIVTSCLIYLALYDGDHIIDAAESLINDLDFGPKRLAVIKENIESAKKKHGNAAFMPEDFLSIFDNNEIIEISIDIDEIVHSLPVNDIESRFYHHGAVREKIVLNEAFKVLLNDNKVFIDKDIEIRAKIICNGTISFHNCTICYGTEADGVIYLGDGASVDIINSRLERTGGQGMDSWGDASRWLFTNEEGKTKQKIKISGSALINCAGVAKFGLSAEVTVDNCYILRPGCIFDNQEEIEFSRSIFVFHDIKTQVPEWYESYYRFSCGGTRFSKCFFYGMGKVRFYGYREVDFLECGFYGLHFQGGIDGVRNINQSDFMLCHDIFDGGWGVNINGSNFSACRKIMSGGYNYSVYDCNFYACNHIASNSDAMVIDMCSFFNSKGRPVIHFDEGVSYIKRSIFDGFDSSQGRLISFDFKKDEYKLRLEDVSFRNIPNARNSAIRTKGSCDDWFGMSTKDIYPVSFTGCTGLDMVSKSCVAAIVNVRTKSIDHKAIGPDLSAELCDYAKDYGMAIPDKKRVVLDIRRANLLHEQWLIACLGLSNTETDQVLSDATEARMLDVTVPTSAQLLSDVSPISVAIGFIARRLL